MREEIYEFEEEKVEVVAKYDEENDCEEFGHRDEQVGERVEEMGFSCTTIFQTHSKLFLAYNCQFQFRCCQLFVKEDIHNADDNTWHERVPKSIRLIYLYDNLVPILFK